MFRVEQRFVLIVLLYDFIINITHPAVEAVTTATFPSSLRHLCSVAEHDAMSTATVFKYGKDLI